MSEALISDLIRSLGSMAFDRIGEEVTLIKDVEVNALGIKSNLETIRVFLEDAERKQLSNASVRLWLEKLKSLSHNMDQVLDEWNTSMLISRVNEDEGDRASKRVRFSWSLSFLKPKLKNLSLRQEIGYKIKELNEKLDVIVSEKDKFNLGPVTVDQPVERPKTTSFVDETETCGRYEDKKTLVSRLLSDTVRGFEIIPILGVGGLGKTYLAQLAFNSGKVKARFDKKIWVCVSDTFDLMKVANAIVEAVEGTEPRISELETLLQRLRDCVEGKRFLLVLDDVWTKDNKKWDQLKQPLKFGAEGSRVIVTTRKQEVAIMMGAMNSAIILEELSEEDCWLILKRLALSERSEEECKELEGIGREISKKCKGLPLVAKILGGHLLFKKTKAQWEDVQRSELWKLRDANEEIFAPFLLSYYDLSATEKRCFSYCAVFPKDRIIGRDELICMWMSQNYLSHDTNPENLGCECFENLAMRSFFQNFEKRGSDGSVTHCKMHDIVHNFARFLTDNECVTIEFDNVEEIVLEPLDERVQHLTIVSESRIKTLNFNRMNAANKRNLRTLLATLNPNTWPNLDYSSLFLHLTCLRSLTLSNCLVYQLPDSIGRLIYLRYLDISNNPCSQLPETLSNLCNLRSLNLLHCNSLHRLPEGIGRLLNLRHLFVGPKNEMLRFPKSFGDLSSLRSLDALFLGQNDEAYFNIGDFKKLRSLQLKGSLAIRECRNLQSGYEAEKVGLRNTPQLDNLLLDFAWTGNSLEIDQDGEILEGLEPHQNLRCLKIRHFMGANLSQRWMASLINLRQIELGDCRNCKILPSLGNLPSLESIQLFGFSRIENVGLEFLGIAAAEEEDHPPTSSTSTIFPKVKKLIFHGMERWEKWEGSSIDAMAETSIRIMPRLSFLEFWSCPRLRVLPDFLKMNTSLQEVEITCSKIIQKWCKEKTGEEWAKISHSPNIKVGVDYVKRDGEWIQEDTSPSPSEQ